MVTRRTIIMIIVLLLAVLLLFLPEKDNSKVQIDPEQIHYELNQNTRFFSTDEIADLLINEDPSLILIDIRSSAEFEKYSLPGAVNIPLAEILNEENIPYFRRDHTKNVLFGNGTALSDQAWMILRRLGYKNLFVMKGGLNTWVETILQPTLPAYTEVDVVEMDKYLFRKAASQYFGQAEKSDAVEEVVLKKPVVVRKTAERSVAGGC